MSDRPEADRLLGVPARRSNIEERTKRAADRLGGALRRSARGVPHVVVPIGDYDASVCFFGSSKTWRVFYPYFSDGGKQVKTTHNNLTEVEHRLDELKQRNN